MDSVELSDRIGEALFTMADVQRKLEAILELLMEEERTDVGVILMPAYGDE